MIENRFPIGGSSENTLPWFVLSQKAMAIVIQEKKRLLAGISRIKWQIEGVERALNDEHQSGEVLLGLAACRGAMNALITEILEGHLRMHPSQSDSTDYKKN